jgi:hypothetical protein
VKITSGHIIDPRQRKRFSDPDFVLLVDEPVEELGGPITLDKRTRIFPCGPFFAVETWASDKRDWTDEGVDLGRFNVLGFREHQLAPVIVDSPEQRLELQMPVPRVRRLLNRHAPNYRIRVDQEAALDGKLAWYYERRTPECFGRTEVPNFEKRPCSRVVSETVLFKGAHINLCQGHHLSHQNYVSRLRITQRNNTSNQRPTG